jgi:hypothetical protein
VISDRGPSESLKSIDCGARARCGGKLNGNMKFIRVVSISLIVPGTGFFAHGRFERREKYGKKHDVDLRRLRFEIL